MNRPVELNMKTRAKNVDEPVTTSNINAVGSVIFFVELYGDLHIEIMFGAGGWKETKSRLSGAASVPGAIIYV